jgi:pimeloyl-ACP methyl ester carboxylesterase
MPLFQKDATTIYYEIRGTGFPLLLLPPGGLRAGIDFWQRTAFAAPEVFAPDFRVIAIDERHSGRSSGPIPAGNPWDAYLADHLGLLNHLGIEKCLVLGCCMGASQVLRLVHAAPQRIAAAVLEQPTAVNEANRQVWSKMWAEWADELLAKGLQASQAESDDFRKRMWADEFVMSVTREAIAEGAGRIGSRNRGAHPRISTPAHAESRPKGRQGLSNRGTDAVRYFYYRRGSDAYTRDYQRTLCDAGRCQCGNRRH